MVKILGFSRMKIRQKIGKFNGFWTNLMEFWAKNSYFNGFFFKNGQFWVIFRKNRAQIREKSSTSEGSRLENQKKFSETHI